MPIFSTIHRIIFFLWKSVEFRRHSLSYSFRKEENLFAFGLQLGLKIVNALSKKSVQDNTKEEEREEGNGQRTDDNDIFNDLMPGLSAVWTHSESSEKSFCKAPSLSRKSSFSFFNLMSNPVFDVPFPVQKDYKENR
jgi:hypothetical protein